MEERQGDQAVALERIRSARCFLSHGNSAHITRSAAKV
jgi:hypothetical protein